jgi:class 3 adenylate cyclase
MMGMVMKNVVMKYNPGLVVFSVIIAYVASSAALWIALNIEHEVLQFVSAFIMAVAVCGMHYTSAGAIKYIFDPDKHTTMKYSDVDSNLIIILIIVIGCTFCFLMNVIISNSSSQTRISYESMIDELNTEKLITDQLLLNILPSHIASRMKLGEQYIYEEYECVTILFADICSFTTLSSNVHPKTIIILLHELFSSFDALCVKMNLEKIKTIGDAYLCVSGLDHTDRDYRTHAVRALHFGLELIECVKQFNVIHFSEQSSAAQRKASISVNVNNDEKDIRKMIRNKELNKNKATASAKVVPVVDSNDFSLASSNLFPNSSDALKIRIGCHSGRVVAGVIGTSKFLYDIFGMFHHTRISVNFN